MRTKSNLSYFSKVLKGKNCVISGATGGIGKEIAKVLTKYHCNLFLIARNNEKLGKLKKELQSLSNNGIKISSKSADLTKLGDVKNVIKKIRNDFSTIDILINCAGVFILKSLSENTLMDYEKCFNVNIRAPFIFCKEFSKDMVDKKWGRIINIGSSSSYTGFKKGSIYCSSKHAILGLSRSLQSELKEHNVRVLCVSPGSTKTGMAKISTDQDFNTFLDAGEVAEFVVFLMLFDKEMVVEEVRLNRMIIK